MARPNDPSYAFISGSLQSIIGSLSITCNVYGEALVALDSDSDTNRVHFAEKIIEAAKEAERKMAEAIKVTNEQADAMIRARDFCKRA